MEAKERNLRRHVGATGGLAQEIRRGRQLVEILDTIVNDAFRGDETMLAKWRVARRVQRVRGGARSPVVFDERVIRADGGADGATLGLGQPSQ